MGQAKRRGSFEQRKAAAVEARNRDIEEHRARAREEAAIMAERIRKEAEAEEARYNAMTPEEQKEYDAELELRRQAQRRRSRRVGMSLVAATSLAVGYM